LIQFTKPPAETERAVDANRNVLSLHRH